MKPERVLLFVVVGMILVAVVAGVVAAVRPVSEFAPGSPEAAVQGFLRAVSEGDGEEAEGFLVGDSDCDASDLERSGMEDVGRVVLLDSEIDDGSARVTVEIVSGPGGGPFDVEEHTSTRGFDLVREGGEWRLTEMPWPLFACREATG